MTVALIAAVADNGVIGVAGALPWRIAADMRWFKAHTMGRPVVMGRKTWDSLPKKQLPGRANIVVTRARDFRNGVHISHSGSAGLTARALLPSLNHERRLHIGTAARP